MPIGTAWVAATAPPEKQMLAFSLVVASILGGFISGSAIAGLGSQIKSGVGVGDGGWFSAVAMSAVLCGCTFLVILLGTAAPPKHTDDEKRPRPEGVKNAVLNLPFLASALTGFVGAGEGAQIVVCLIAVLSNPKPQPVDMITTSQSGYVQKSPADSEDNVPGYGYTSGSVGIVFVVNCIILLLSSIFFSQWLGSRTEPLQRVVLLGLVTTTTIVILGSIMYSIDVAGLWDGGDILFSVPFYSRTATVLYQLHRRQRSFS